MVLSEEQTDGTYLKLTKIDYVFWTLRFTSAEIHTFELPTHLTKMCIG